MTRTVAWTAVAAVVVWVGCSVAGGPTERGASLQANGAKPNNNGNGNGNGGGGTGGSGGSNGNGNGGGGSNGNGNSGAGSPSRTVGSSSITIAGLFCGVSTNSYDGLLCDGTNCGLPNGKLACQTACSSATAHVCGASEIVQSLQVGLGGTIASALPSPASGWIVAGGWADTTGGTGGFGGGVVHAINDCAYFSDNGGNSFGVAVTTNGAAIQPTRQPCNAPAQIACCD